MHNEELVFIYKLEYYVYRKDSLGEYILRLMWGEEYEGYGDYLYICNDGVNYSELLDERDSWKIQENYKKGWVFPRADLSRIFEGNCVWSFELCYYDSDIEDDRVFTRWEDLMPWVMKLILLSSDIQILVEYLGVFHNDHGRVEFTASKKRRQFYWDILDNLLLEREV